MSSLPRDSTRTRHRSYERSSDRSRVRSRDRDQDRSRQRSRYSRERSRYSRERSRYSRDHVRGSEEERKKKKTETDKNMYSTHGNETHRVDPKDFSDSHEKNHTDSHEKNHTDSHGNERSHSKTYGEYNASNTTRADREREERAREEELKRIKDPIFQATKDERTVLLQQIHPKVDERALYEYFSACGTVLDVRLLCDQFTRKSKGVAYIEFESSDSVIGALALSGQLIGGFPVTITCVAVDKLRVPR